MLDLKQLSNIIIPIITGFPLFISTIQNILKQLKLDEVIGFNLIYFILEKVKIPTNNQIHELIYSNILNGIAAIVFFIFFQIHGIKDPTHPNLFFKLSLLFLNLITAIGVFTIFPTLDNYISE